MSVVSVPSRTRPRVRAGGPQLAYALLGALAIAYCVAAAGGAGDRPAAAALALVVAFGAAAMTFVRVVVRPGERLAWAAIATALLTWSSGDLLVRVLTADGAVLPIPSIADVAYLLFYPCAALGLLLLARARVRVATAVVWIDGLIAALTLAAACAVLLVDPLVRIGGESTAQFVTNLLYPVWDFVLALVCVGYIGLRAGRLDRAALLLCAGLLLSTATDGLYLVETLRGPYDEGGPLSAAYLLASLLVGAAAWQPRGPVAVLREERQRVVTPIVCGALCIAILVGDHYDRAETSSVWLAGAALLAVLARFALTFRAGRRLLDERDREALTDHVTALRNRRALMRDLAAAAAAPPTAGRHLLVVLDLDGFKHYNDSFGHLAGDALLARLGCQLQELAAGAGGFAYRMGGDEFCLLAPLERTADAELLALRAAAALSETGDGARVAASCGQAIVGGEPGAAHDGEAALRLADERMYAQKAARRAHI